MKESFKLYLLLLFLLLGFSGYLFFPSKALAGSSPYDVPTSVRNGWDTNYGGKHVNEYSGKMLIYDVYSQKYVSNGYSIQSRNFGQGTQPYVWFTGWSVLFGHKDHTATNNDTYIVAKKVSGTSGIGTEKVYGTITRGWHATEDLEYNNQGSGIWNECASSVTNVPNDTCNMRYDYVGFEAFLPLNELFPNSKENASWRLFIVKTVDSRIVYTPLILPFHFDNRSFNGGTIDLTSGINANTLTMNTSGVLRRSYPRETASSVIGDLGSNRYFTEGQNYTRVDVDESETAIWYGVRSPHDGNRTKWGATSYWAFGGTQAMIDYTPPPNKPPVANFSYSPTTIYNNTTVNFTELASDPDGDPLTYQWAYQTPGSSTWVNFSTSANPSKVLNIKGTWDIKLTVKDPDGLTDTVIKSPPVVNRPPVANFSYSPTTIYNNTTVNFTEQASDPDGDTITYQWAYQTPGSTTWTNFSTSANPSKVLNIKGTWDIRLTVTDSSGATDTVTKSPGVVNRPPIADFSYSPTTIYNNTTVNFTELASDPDGDTITYQWAYQTPGSTTWVNFSNSANPSKVLNIKGTWDIRLTVTDSSGATDTVTKSPVVVNRPPIANFSYSPTTIYNNTTVNFTELASDPDGDTITYQWAYQTPGSTTWVNFSTSANPSKVLNIKGTWDIRLTVTDSSGATASKIKSPVVLNRSPIADFSYSPTTIYNNTTVNFTELASDPDGDTITYQWAYQTPGTTTWVNFSTSANPSKVLNIKGTWNIRLTVTDVDGATHSVTKSPVVLNRSPIPGFVFDKTTYYEGDKFTVTSTASDPDGDTLSYTYVVTRPNGTQATYNTADFSYSSPLVPGIYSIKQTVTDTSNVSAELTKTINAIELVITGKVDHTPDWKTFHNQHEHPEHFFYSGERFLLTSAVTNYHIEFVNVQFAGKQINGVELKIVEDLIASPHPVYKGEVYDSKMSEPTTKLYNGEVYFLFTAKWKNGVTKQDLVSVEIIDDVYKAYDFHRTN